MRLATNDEFLGWAKQRGIGVNSRYSDPAQSCFWLHILSGGGERRFWAFPFEARELLVFVTSILKALDPWESCRVLKRVGSWSYAEDGEGQDLVLESIGIPEGFGGSVEFLASEGATLLLLLVTQLAFASNPGDDLWVVPDHGRQVIFTDHDGAVHLLFAAPEHMGSFVEAMRENGFPLPDEPPNESLRWPNWMGPKPPDWPC
jgi:hypothetical protein